MIEDSVMFYHHMVGFIELLVIIIVPLSFIAYYLKTIKDKIKNE